MKKGFSIFLTLLLIFTNLLPVFSFNVSSKHIFSASPDEHQTQMMITASDLFKSNKYNEALPIVQELLKSFPDDDTVQFIAGMCYFLTERYPESISYLEKAYKLKPYKMDYAYFTGASYYLSGNKQESIPYLRKSCSFQKDKRTCKQMLADSYFKTSDYNNALKLYKELEKKYSKPFYCSMIAVSKEYTGGMNSAELQMSECVQKFPQDAETNYVYGKYLRLQHKPSEAKDYFIKAVRLNSSYKSRVELELSKIGVASTAMVTEQKAVTAVNNRALSASSTYQTIKESPSSYVLENATPLYSGAISSVNATGKAFAREHGIVAEHIVENINQLTENLLKTRTLNDQYYDSLTVQLTLWKMYSDKNPKLKPIYNDELELYNYASLYKMKEDILWAAIDAKLDTIKQLNNENNVKANESFTKSFYYSDLLLAYIELLGLYQNKYGDMNIKAAYYHSIQDNKNLKIKISQGISNRLGLLHKEEKQRTEVLFFDLAKQIEIVDQINEYTVQINEIHYRMDKYTVDQLTKAIQDLKIKAEKIRDMPQDDPGYDISRATLPIVKGYIDFYEALNIQVKDNIIAYEVKEALKIVESENNAPVLIASAAYLLPDSVYTISLWDKVKSAGSTIGDAASSVANNGVKLLQRTVTVGLTTAAAGANYTFGKGAQLYNEASDKFQAAKTFGLFSKEYQEYSKAYNEASKNMKTTSIMDTFARPVVSAIMEGKMDQSVGLGFKGASRAIKTTSTAVTSTVDVTSSYLADKYYGTNTAKPIINIVQAVAETAMTGKTDESMQRVKAAAGTVYAGTDSGTRYLADKVYGTKTSNAQEKFYKPLDQFLSGQDYSIGQEQIHQTNIAYKEFDKSLKNTDGSNSWMNLAASYFTGPGADLAKMLDDKESQANRDAGAIGVFLALIPVQSTVVNKNMRNTLTTPAKNLFKNAKKAFGKIKKAISDKQLAREALKKSKDSVLKNLDDSLQAALTGDKKALSIAMDAMDDAFKGTSNAQMKYLTASKQCNQITRKNIQEVGKNLIDDAYKAGGDVYKEILQANSPKSIKEGVKDLYAKSLTDLVKDSGGITGFLIDNTIGTAYGKAFGNSVDNALSTAYGKDISREANAKEAVKKPVKKKKVAKANSSLNKKYSEQQKVQQQEDAKVLQKKYEQLQKEAQEIKRQQQARKRRQQKQLEKQNKELDRQEALRKLALAKEKARKEQQAALAKQKKQSSLHKAYPDSALSSESEKPVVIIIPNICRQSTYSWIPSRVCLEAWNNSGKNLVKFHREAGNLIRKYGISRNGKMSNPPVYYRTKKKYIIQYQ